MNYFTVEIPFEPHAKRSPVVAHNPKTRVPIIRDPDRDLKHDLSMWILDNCKLPHKPLEGAIAINMQFRVPIPQSISNKEHLRRSNFKWAFENKKDLDNMQKLYQDILNFGYLKGKIFSDDHLICQSETHKIWSNKPGIFIYLRELTEPFYSIAL